VEITMLIPKSPPTRRISSSISRRPSGSRPAVGSVEERDHGIVDESLGERDALLHSRRVGPHLPVSLLEQPDVTQYVGRPQRAAVDGRPLIRAM
jgi:hypothetical protein